MKKYILIGILFLLPIHLFAQKQRKKERAELKNALQEIEYLKKEVGKLQGFLADDDGDGVLNPLDQEPDTPKDCPVNTLGVALDTDNDGIIDCKEVETCHFPLPPIDEMLLPINLKIADSLYFRKDDPAIRAILNKK